MKLIFTVILSIWFISVFSQNNPPTPDEVRLMIAQSITDLKVDPEPVALVENSFVTNGIDSIPIRVYNPSPGKSLPIVYLVHGAAWVAGDLDTHDNICRYLANHLQVIVVALHYRRPPEHKFPATFDDSYTVMKWIAANTGKLNGNGQLVLVGDSAGGQLAGSLCLVNAGEPKPIPVLAQVLVNPALNLSKDGPSYATYAMFVDWYLNETDNRSDIRISPLLAANMKGVPQTIIVVGEKDKIRRDGEDYHEKLIQAGIPSSLYVQPNAGHLGGLWCATHDMAKPAMDFVVNSMQKILANAK